MLFYLGVAPMFGLYFTSNHLLSFSSYAPFYFYLSARVAETLL